jgi:FkbM family methyltransferase
MENGIRGEIPVISISLADIAYQYRDHPARDVADLVNFTAYCVNNMAYSRSQLLQDLWVLYENDDRKGYYVEFGATNGLDSSNTWLLWDRFWQGVLCEPNPVWHNALAKNRGQPEPQLEQDKIFHYAVADQTGNHVDFLLPRDFPELATEQRYIHSDYNGQKRVLSPGETIKIETITLNDLLEKAEAPKVIDYISLDTEGGELDILNAFDFDKWQVKMFTIEHNYTANREKIWQLMTSKGYKRKFEQYSKWDDWYILDEKTKN